MARSRKSRYLTLFKLSPLYLVAMALFYVLFLMDKEVNYLSEAQDRFRTGRYEEALDLIDRAMEKVSYRGNDLLDVLMLRARTLARMKGYGRAIADLDKIVQLSPHSWTAVDARSLKGEILIQKRDFKAALQVYEAMLGEPQVRENEDRFADLQSRVAAAAYNLSSALQADAATILRDNMEDPSSADEALERFVTDLDHNQTPEALKTVFLDKLSEKSSRRAVDLARESNRLFRYAYSILDRLSYEPRFVPMASNFLVHILYRSRRWLPAVMEASLALKEPVRFPRRIGFLQIQADIYYALGRFSKAAEILEEILRSVKRPDPRLGPVQRRKVTRNLLMALVQAHEYDRILKNKKGFQRILGEDPILYYALGAAYFAKKAPLNAVPLLQNVIGAIQSGKEPLYFSDSPARKECLHLLCRVYTSIHAEEKALNVLDLAVRLYPREPEFLRRRAVLLDRRLSRPADAVQDYRRLLEQGPRNEAIFQAWLRCAEANYRKFRGNTYAERASMLVDKFERQERFLGNDVKRYPELIGIASFPEATGEPLLRLAIAEEFVARGYSDLAKSLLRMLVLKTPGITEFSYRLACLYFRDGNLEAARRAFDRVLEKDPEDFDAIRRVLLCHAKLGDLIGRGRRVRSVLEERNPALRKWMLARLMFEKKAYNDFFKMMKSFGKLPPEIREDLDLMAARAHIECGRFKNAAKILDPMLEKTPDLLEALEVKAYLLASTTPPPSPDSEEVAPLEEGGEEHAAADGVEAATAVKAGEEPAKGDTATPKEVGKKGQEAAPMDTLPEASTEAEQIVDHIREAGDRLSTVEVEETAEAFLKAERPDLVLRLFHGIEAFLPVTSAMAVSKAKALHRTGHDEEAAKLLVSLDDGPENRRRVLALALEAEKTGLFVMEILRDSTNMLDEGELYLRAAGGSILEGDSTAAAAFLDRASLARSHGNFRREEAEDIDFLTRILIHYKRMGVDIHPPAAPPSEVDTEQEGGDTAEKQEEAVEGPGASVAGKEGNAPGKGEAATPSEEAADTVQGKGLAPSVQGSGRGLSKKRRFRKPEPGAEPALRGEGEGKNLSSSTGVKDEDWTAEQIVLDGKSLKERYRLIVPEAVYLANQWRHDPQESVPAVRNFLKHLLLRRVPGFEGECRALAEEIHQRYPGCGTAARFLLKENGYESDAKKVVDYLKPVILEVPDDPRVLSLLAPALAERGIQQMARSCLKHLKDLSGEDSLLPRRIEAEVRLTEGAPEEALRLCRGILAEKPEDRELLLALVPVLGKLHAAKEIAEAATLLDGADGMDEEAAHLLVNAVRRLPPDAQGLETADLLMGKVPPQARIRLIAFLASALRKANNRDRLVELADSLSPFLDNEKVDRNALYEALGVVESSLEAMKETDHACRILEYQYFVKPAKADPLNRLAAIHRKQGQMEKAAQYLELYNILRPWDARKGVLLTKLWFFRLGAFEKAVGLLSYRKGYFKEDPPLVFRILAGWSILQGDPAEVQRIIDRYRSEKKVKTAENLFLIAAFHYIQGDEGKAVRVFRLLKDSFGKSRYAERAAWFVERISNKQEDGKKDPTRRTAPGRPAKAHPRDEEGKREEKAEPDQGTGEKELLLPLSPEGAEKAAPPGEEEKPKPAEDKKTEKEQQGEAEKEGQDKKGGG